MEASNRITYITEKRVDQVCFFFILFLNLWTFLMIFQIGVVGRRSKIEKRVKKNLALPKIEIWITEIWSTEIQLGILSPSLRYERE